MTTEHSPDNPYSSSANVPLDSDGRLDVDIHCIACDYNLRGLSPDDRCPECSTPLEESTARGLLRFSEPQWLKTLASGLEWIIANACLHMVATVATFTVAILSIQLTSGSLESHVASGLSTLFWIAYVVVGVIGYWKVTTPEPNALEEKQPFNARNVARFACIISYLPLILSLSPLHEIAVPAVSDVGWVIGLVGMAAVFLYGVRLAQRIPNHRLVRSTRIVMWGFIASSAANRAVWIWVVFSKPIISFNAVGVISFVAMAFSIWGIVLIIRYHKAFRQQAETASALAHRR